jgi:chromosome segregation ATPase
MPLKRFWNVVLKACRRFFKAFEKASSHFSNPFKRLFKGPLKAFTSPHRPLTGAW